MNNLIKGGAERVIVQLAYQFQKDGYEVLIITSFKDKDEYIIPENVKRVCLAEKQDFGNRFRRNVRLIGKLRKMIINEKPDLLIAFMQEPNFRAIVATIGLTTKTLISVRNDPEREYAGKVGKLVGKFILPIADGCVFQTEQARQWFPEKLKKKSRIILNEVAEDFFKIKYSPKKKIVAIGRLNEQKNHELLIKAFDNIASNYQDFNLYIYGEGPLRSKLQNLIDAQGLGERVFLMGIKENIAQVLSEATVFVLSSDYEGMPNALLEALAVGVPCIATDCPCGGPRTIIKPEESGLLISVNNQKALESSLKRILSDKELRHVLSKNAQISAQQFRPDIIYCNWKNYALDIIEHRTR